MPENDYNHDYVKKFLESLNFNLIEGRNRIWVKNYPEHNRYAIKVDLNNESLNECKIDYGQLIQRGRATTSNLSQKESLVVLECVNRLLQVGYKPESIELEKGWRVGGYLDILVNDFDGKSYLMIECKTWGEEYEKAIKIILENQTNREQLFNYYLQEKSTKYVALYTSTLINEAKIIYRNDIIPVEQFKQCNNQDEVYTKWDKVFQSKGIFEEEITPYGIVFSGIKKKDLKQLDQSYIYGHGEGTIFNRFAEVLRRQTVSDKTNAYNKIFNLFLCKIVDEDNAVNQDYEMEFQWKESENPENVLSRLNDLYKKGMRDYLKLEVTDFTEDELDTELNKLNIEINGDTQEIREMFRKLRLYKNTEFTFKEVIDERTFLENSEVVKEVVKLLEPYQIKYSHKYQFLGEFFEKLLNIGIKQESGQFFTPIPITTFVCKSIPFEDLIKDKINANDPNFLPYVIDYACGSGHFLTESMDRIDEILQSIQESDLNSNSQKDNYIGWQRSYKWALEFIYGIEKDYRLAKTTQVACFLNGDGEANILYSDGLSSFNSENYRDRLKLANLSKENPVYDVVVSNPPYSVENFKFTLKNGDESFDLYDYITDKSDDIECIFVERTKQLLKQGGYAAIILPSTILLTNSNLFTKTREIILKYFDIYAISEFGSNTFAASGQKTIILFMKRRTNNHWRIAERLVRRFFENKTDFSYKNEENIIEKYLLFVHPDLTFDKYIEDLEDISDEFNKILFFLLTFNLRVVISKAGEGQEEKLFLGYEHSKMRKYEGIHPYPSNETGIIDSKLYNNSTLDDENKISTFIYRNFKSLNLPEINENLKDHLNIKYLHEMVDFESNKFLIYLETLQNPFLESKYPLVSLDNEQIAEILDHMRRPVRESMRTSGQYPYYGASGQTGTIDNFIFDEKLVLIGEDGAKWNKGGKTAYIVEGKCWVNNHAHVIRPNPEKLDHEYLELIFERLDFSFLKTRPNGGKLLKSAMESIKFPLPEINVQKEIVSQVSQLSDVEKYDVLDTSLN